LIEYYGVNPSIASVVHLGFKPLLSTREVLLSDAALERPYLLFVGFRQNYKNFSTLLLAFAHSGLSANCDLLTVGGGPLSSEELLHAKSLGVAACLKNVRDVNDAALASIYARASLLVYPSLYEGFGLPPLEAMSMGCPVLASSTSSMPEVCGEAAEYFNPEDAGELSRVMVEVLNNPQSLAEMRARGYERVERFDWNVTAAKTYAIYSDVLRH
jgi:glycosyltransferase involved in cell wall biosynthesis